MELIRHQQTMEDVSKPFQVQRVAQLYHLHQNRRNPAVSKPFQVQRVAQPMLF